MRLGDLEEILNTLDWLPPKEEESSNNVVDWESKYNNLKEHHSKERQFLIDKCRKLAKIIKSYKEWDEY